MATSHPISPTFARIQAERPKTRTPFLFVPAALCLFSGAARAQETAPPSPRPARIQITAPQPLNARREWRPSDGDDGFLSTTPIRCAAEATDPGEEALILWRVTVFRGARAVGALTGSGPSFTFRAADAARRQPAGPLAVEIVAELAQEREGQTSEAGAVPQPAVRNPNSIVRIQQDEIDQIRQEYLDLPGRKLSLVPRRAFINRAAYEQLGTLSFPWPDLNRTRRRGGGCYDYILFTDALRDGLRRWQEQLGARGLTINSGFRNPFKQLQTNSRGGRDAASGSMHQYGRAVDVAASLRRDFRDWVQVAWAALDAGADYVETAPEGGWSHVHADWRNDGQGPPLTVKLEITGRVIDPEGNPVPAARVLGASDAVGGLPGMPAWEGPDEEGRFTLRTIWRPGRPYNLRASTDESAAGQALTIPESATGLIHLDTELVLMPEPLRQALTRRRSLRLASRGGFRRSSPQRRRGRRG